MNQARLMGAQVKPITSNLKFTICPFELLLGLHLGGTTFTGSPA
jgi:hypothetical protein